LSYSKNVIDKAKKIKDIYKVRNDKSIMDEILTITRVVRNSTLWLMLLLSVIAVFIISNTIKITVLARKEEIQLRKLIGATNNFIRTPFFIEGSFIGLLGASIACLLIVIGYYFVYTYFNKYIDIAFIELVSPFPLIPLSCLILLVFGALIGIWGAISSLRRILKV
jgi:cell division transport system permease protein